MGRPSRFSSEVRERAGRMMFGHESEYDSQWAAIDPDSRGQDRVFILDAS